MTGESNTVEVGLNTARRSGSEELLLQIKEAYGPLLRGGGLSLGDVVLYASRENFFSLMRNLKEDSRLAFNLLIDITAIDWMDSAGKGQNRSVLEDTGHIFPSERYEVVYHLLSLSKQRRVRIKVELSEADPMLDSVTSLWSGANFMERETWDMYGINFRGHPDLRRLLMYDEFVGHPLRKDYPIRGKQPRVRLISPEVHNTASDLVRPTLTAESLVRIRRRQPGASESSSTSGSVPRQNQPKHP